MMMVILPVKDLITSQKFIMLLDSSSFSASWKGKHKEVKIMPTVS